MTTGWMKGEEPSRGPDDGRMDERRGTYSRGPDDDRVDERRGT